MAKTKAKKPQGKKPSHFVDLIRKSKTNPYLDGDEDLHGFSAFTVLHSLMTPDSVLVALEASKLDKAPNSVLFTFLYDTVKKTNKRYKFVQYHRKAKDEDKIHELAQRLEISTSVAADIVESTNNP